MFKQNFLCFRLHLLPLALSLYTTEKSPAPSSPLLLLGIYANIRSPWNFPRLKSPISQSLLILYWLIQLLQVLNCLHGTSLDSCRFVHISFVLGEPRTGPRTPHVSHQCWVQVQDHLPRPAGRPLGCFATSLSCKVPLNGSKPSNCPTCTNT